MFLSIPQVLDLIQDKKMFILVDSEDRENEGDLVIAAQDITPEMVNFMVTRGRGLICVPITKQRAQNLQFTPMVRDNRDSYKTAFTISVDAAQDVTTGISAYDRYKTIQKIASEHSNAQDFRRPGHIFPLIAKKLGVLARAGHTEASVDLMQLAGKVPVAVICEIMNDNGTMARLSDLENFSKKFKVPIVTIESLIEYRLKEENFISEISSTKLENEYSTFTLKIFQNSLDQQQHYALVKGDPSNVPIVRVHTENLFEDIFLFSKLSTSPSIPNIMQKLSKNNDAIFLYIQKKNRNNINLNRIQQIQNVQKKILEPHKTSETSEKLRNYGIGAQILRKLGVTKMKLISNQPKSIVGLEAYGISVTEVLSS